MPKKAKIQILSAPTILPLEEINLRKGEGVWYIKQEGSSPSSWAWAVANVSTSCHFLIGDYTDGQIVFETDVGARTHRVISYVKKNNEWTITDSFAPNQTMLATLPPSSQSVQPQVRHAQQPIPASIVPPPSQPNTIRQATKTNNNTTLLEQSMKNLNESIKQLETYGNHLLESGGVTWYNKAMAIRNLAYALQSDIQMYTRNTTVYNERNFNDFKKNFENKLNRQNEIFATYRTKLKPILTILANILIALTGVGAVLLAINAIQSSKKNQGLSLNTVCFFGKTHSETLKDRVEAELRSLAFPLTNAHSSGV